MWLSSILATVVVILSTGCSQEIPETIEQPSEPNETSLVSIDGVSYEKTTIAEASSILGVVIPIPKYLPDDCQIQDIYIRTESSEASFRSVLFLVSAKDVEWVEGVPECEIELHMGWSEVGRWLGIKVPGERVSIKGSTEGGVIVDLEDCIDLWWHWRPDPDKKGEFEIQLSATKHLSKEELVKIAESLKQ